MCESMTRMRCMAASCTGKVRTSLAAQAACGLMSFPVTDDGIGTVTQMAGAVKHEACCKALHARS